MEPDSETTARSDRKKKIDIIKSHKRHKAEGENDSEELHIRSEWVSEWEEKQKKGFREIYGPSDKNKDLSGSDREGKQDGQLWRRDRLRSG